MLSVDGGSNSDGAGIAGVADAGPTTPGHRTYTPPCVAKCQTSGVQSLVVSLQQGLLLMVGGLGTARAFKWFRSCASSVAVKVRSAEIAVILLYQSVEVKEHDRLSLVQAAPHTKREVQTCVKGGCNVQIENLFVRRLAA